MSYQQFAKKISLKTFSSKTYRIGITNDLVVSASMGWSAKEPKTHQEHFQTIKNLNLYQDQEIDIPIKTLDKQYFCIPKVQQGQQQISKFNPYSLDPQNIGNKQVLTSTVMHPLSLQILYEALKTKLQKQKTVRFIDFGCGFGYSTLAFALLGDQLMSHQNSQFQVIGVDIHQDFIEGSIINYQRFKKSLINPDRLNVDFQGKIQVLQPSFQSQIIVNDYLNNDSIMKLKNVDIINFGFETSLNLLEQRQQQQYKLQCYFSRSILNDDSYILAPISNDDQGSQEQTYSLLNYSNKEMKVFIIFFNCPSCFQVIKEIMKTSFSLKVDKSKEMNDSLDQDYFNTYMRQQKIDQFKKELAILEQQFKNLKDNHFGDNNEIKLTELIKVPAIQQVLQKIRENKQKIQKLEFAIKDSMSDDNNKDINNNQ